MQRERAARLLGRPSPSQHGLAATAWLRDREGEQARRGRNGVRTTARSTVQERTARSMAHAGAGAGAEDDGAAARG